MAESNTEQWYPTAAYLYVLHLDGPALAWEYLRRNPAYRRDWLRGDADFSKPAHRWGLRLLEDPNRDARDAQPDWLSDPDNLVHLSPEDSTDAQAQSFHVWELPGYRYLTHDGERLVLTSQLPQHILRVAIPTTLEDGQPFAYAVPAGANLQRRWRTAAVELRWLDPPDASHIAVSAVRPGRAALLHLRTLQALDGVLAGASHRELGAVFFGAAAIAKHWHDGSDLRAQVRRFVRRGRVLMLGGYRRLLQTDGPENGRSH
jgi:hypothetical protein